MHSSEIGNIALTLSFTTSVQMILKLYDILYMGDTFSGLYIFFVVLDYRSFSSKTGEFVSLLETANASSIQKRFNIPKFHFNSSLHYENQYHLYIKLEEEEAKDQGLVKIPDTNNLYRFTTICKEDAVKKYKIHS
tara:strand:+ start:589 stop:993 length:405 start_codon:yes stop_codon:yes gene_type:complete